MSTTFDKYRIDLDETVTYLDERLDKVLSENLPDISRTRLKALILEGQVRSETRVLKKPSEKLSDDIGTYLEVRIPAAVDDTPQAQNISLDIIYEDEHLLVINKPAGLVVHPGAGNADQTLVNALLFHCKDSLSGIGGVKRPGIVHRLDKDTSGVMVVAKNDAAHKGLSEQLSEKTMGRIYHTIVLNVPVPPTGAINKPLGRHPQSRMKQAVLRYGGRDAVTNYKTLDIFRDNFALVECRLETGRTHQIRVHMQEKGLPVLGDPVYGPQATAVKGALKRGGWDEDITEVVTGFKRQALHAKELFFEHPILKKDMSFSSGYPSDIHGLIESLSK
ncbi:MAG: RNA pseudouridine synthase [Micavibrio sp.]|nr:RNA pseudouridine synthase [Micavibrio sp.]